MKSVFRHLSRALVALWATGVSVAQVTSIVNVTGNNTDLWTSNNGHIAFNEPAGLPGLRLNSQMGTLVFAGGLFLGGLKTGYMGAPDTINVAQAEFFTEFQRGRILNSGAVGNLLAEDPLSPSTGIFVLPDDIASWPPDAPHDVSGQPLQLSAVDSWCTFHDLNDSLDEGLFSPAPVFGLQIQRQTFQWTEGVLNDAVLVRMKIFNKSDRHYPAFYIGCWTDAKVGLAESDFPGSDSSLGLVYVYNDSSDADGVAYGTTLLQGPIVSGSASDTARLVTVGPSGITIERRPGNQILMASSATAYPNNPGGNCGQNIGDLCRYHYLQGLTAVASQNPADVFPWTTSIHSPGSNPVPIVSWFHAVPSRWRLGIRRKYGTPWLARWPAVTPTPWILSQITFVRSVPRSPTRCNTPSSESRR